MALDEYSDLSQWHATSWKLAFEKVKSETKNKKRKKDGKRTKKGENGFVNIFTDNWFKNKILENHFIKSKNVWYYWIWCEYRWKLPPIISSHFFSLAYEMHELIGQLFNLISIVNQYHFVFNSTNIYIRQLFLPPRGQFVVS